MKNATIQTIRVCLFAAGTLAFGQSAASSVEGKVVNAASGSPVKHATVSLRLTRSLPMAPGQTAAQPGTNTAETDEQGRFIFSNVLPGGYSLTAQHQRFLNPVQGRIARPTPVLMVGENQQMTGVVLRLDPPAVISGKILDTDGEAIAGVQVFAMRPSSRNGSRQLTPAMVGLTIASNDLGEFRISGLAAGSYVVMAGTPRANTVVYETAPQQEKPELAYTNTYYPGTADAGRATPVTVTVGAEVRGIDIKLAKTKAVSIRGQVIDQGASSDRQAMVSLVRRNAGGPMAGGVGSVGAAITLPGGAFRINGVPPGSYQLIARRGNDEGRTVAAASVPLEVGDTSPDAISVRVLPVVDIEGRMKSSQPARCDGGYLSLVDETGFNGVPSVRLSSASGFTLRSVAPATYRLNVSMGGQCYVESVRFGGREITDMQVKVDGVGPLEITMASSDASVTGKVTDAAGKPAEGALVALLPKGAAGSGAPTSFTSRTGAFSIYGIRPGAYDSFAWESVEYASAQSPEFAKQFQSSARSIAVEPGGRQRVDLTLIPASATGEPAPSPTLPSIVGSVEGQVVNAVTGAPLGATTVTLGMTQRAASPQGTMGAAIGAPASQPEATVETDEQGRFTFRSVDPDVYYISAERRGFTSAGPAGRAGMIGNAIVVGNGQRLSGYTIKLAPQGVIAGKVVDEFGEPAVNLQAVLYRAEYGSGVRRLVRMAVATTDDLGKFRLAGMAPGAYYLATMRSPQNRLSRPTGQEPANEVGFGIVWYPNAAEAAGATPVVVAAAAEVSIDIVTRRTKLATIRGTVADGEGGSVERPVIGLTPRGLATATSIGIPIMRPGGEFEVSNVPAGSYILSARMLQNGTPAARSQRMAFLPVEVRDSNIEGVQLRLTSGRQVRGTVKWEGGGMRSGSLSGSTAEGISAWAQVSPMDGTFTFPSIWPLTYTLDMSLPAECYVKSIRYGGRDAQGGEVDFNGDGELEIVVSASAASLDGVAVDRQQRPASGATVVLSPADTPGRVLSGRADGQGAFHFGGLRPGSYRAYAFEGDAADLSPESLATFQPRATMVVLQESARGKVQLATIQR
jgi:protocatechuate 3,4-dioxygenase beta subunit